MAARMSLLVGEVSEDGQEVRHGVALAGLATFDAAR
jgi:hypothetical protein